MGIFDRVRELWEKSLKNGDPGVDNYWKWCKYQLMLHKPWADHPATLWNTTPDNIGNITEDQYKEAWKIFTETDERGRRVVEHHNRYRTERTAIRDTMIWSMIDTK